MHDEIFKMSQNFYKFNFNFIVDNLKINVHHFTIETFDKYNGFDFHKHSSYELHYVKSGHGEVHFDNNKCFLKPGDLYLCSPYSIHKQIVYNYHMIEYSLRFDIEELNTVTNNTCTTESSLLLSLLESGSCLIIPKQINIEHLFEQSFKEAIDKKPGYYIKIKQNITSMIISIARCYTSKIQKKTYNLPTKDINTHRMEMINKYIMDNISSKISNQDISLYTHLSIRQLYRVIKKNSGLSTHDYINMIKINHAKAILQQKDKTLDKIAQLLGYSSAFHFSALFKQYTGYSPKKYLQITENSDIHDV